jgi:hypothetical protein
MIKRQSLLALAATLRMDKKKVEDAIASDQEIELNLPENISVFTSAELSSREEQLKNNAIRMGKELMIKDLKEATGLKYDGQGSKDPDRFIEEYKSNLLKGLNTSETERVQKLNSEVSTLQKTYDTLKKENDLIVTRARESKLNADILSWTIEKKPDNLTNDEWVGIMKLNNEFVETDGQLVVHRNGEPVLNKVDLKPIAPKDALLSFIEERNLGKVVEPTERRFGRKGMVRGISSMSEFTNHLRENNIDPKSERAQSMLREITSENPNFDFKIS